MLIPLVAEAWPANSTFSSLMKSGGEGTSAVSADEGVVAATVSSTLMETFTVLEDNGDIIGASDRASWRRGVEWRGI